AYLKRLAEISPPAEAARYRDVLDPRKIEAVDAWFRKNEPRHNSMLRTSISPNIIQAGYRFNVIPSEAEASLDIRALPDEDMTKFYETLKSVINDPAIKLIPQLGSARPGAPPSALGNEAFRAIEAVA